MTEIPQDVLSWVREVFAGCNRSVTGRLDRNPNAPEQSFDLAWVDELSRYSAPTRFQSEWMAKIEAHYLGGLRHFDNWEIADIAVLVFLRLGPGHTVNKVVLLQSKRLYPLNRRVREETRSDYEIGLARLADSEDLSASIGQETEFVFDSSSKYAALREGSDQMRAIDAYEKQQKLHVYYHFYNPWRIPMRRTIPLVGYAPPDGDPDLGVRVVPASAVHGAAASGKGSSPTLGQLDDLTGVPPTGWRLEDFVEDEVLGC
jgi:hypothetical protein